MIGGGANASGVGCGGVCVRADSSASRAAKRGAMVLRVATGATGLGGGGNGDGGAGGDCIGRVAGVKPV